MDEAPKAKTGLVRRALAALVTRALNLQGVNAQGSWFGPWWGPIQESFTGAWQTNTVVAPSSTLLSFSAVFACVTGIASDIAKLRIKLVARSTDGIWEEIGPGSQTQERSPWLGVLAKPNHFQTRIKFIEQWIVSKLLYGNTYVLKQREDGLRGLVKGLYILHPNSCKPLVAEDGSVYYEIDRDFLSRVTDRVVVPASEIIHDMMVSLWHPLIGVSPLYACSVSTTLGNTIQKNSQKFYENRSMPGGMLTAPGAISKETALRLKNLFESNFSGDNIGRLFVAGDGLEYKPYGWNAEQSQTMEQLKWTVEDVARAFRYPLYKLGGQLPPYANGPEAAQLLYYTDCIQYHAECVELCLDEGLELPVNIGTEFDTDNLLRMDTKTMLEAIEISTRSSTTAPNENRKRLNLPPVIGGNSPMIQQQNYSLEAIAKRDAKDDPFASTSAPKEPSPVEPNRGAAAIQEPELSRADAVAMLREVYAP